MMLAAELPREMIRLGTHEAIQIRDDEYEIS